MPGDYQCLCGNLGSGSNPTSVSVQSRLWFNPADTLKYIGPGAVAIALTLFPHWLAWLQPEREQGTILWVYASSLSGRYLLGKAAAYWLVGMAEVLLVNLLAWPFFRTGLLATRPHLGFMLLRLVVSSGASFSVAILNPRVP